MSTKKRKPEPILEQPWAYSWLSRPAGLLAVLYLVHLTLWNFDVPLVWVAGVGALFVFFAWLLFPDAQLRDHWFHVTLSLAAVAHLIWGRVTIPWGRDQLLAAFGGTVAFGLWWHILVVSRQSAAARRNDQRKAAEAEVERGRFVDMIARTMKKEPDKIGITEKRREPFPAGMRVYLDVRHAGTEGSWNDLGVKLDRLADVRDGTHVFERGETAGEVVLNVFERDVLAEEIPYPFETGPKSIHAPMPLGQFATGEVCVVTFRELAALMVGIKGRGKSALLNTHLAYLTGCQDAVVWMMDGKGGRTARPWLQPFLEAVKAGRDGTPALDWVAITEPEYDAMLLAVNAAIKYRSRGAGDKIVPTPSQPSIILIVEEASVITGTGTYGNVKRADLAKTAVVQGRSEAIDAIFASQRATVTMLGSGDMKSNLDLRYGLGVIDPYDARDIFTDGKLAQSLFALGDDDRYRGVFLMQAPGQRRVIPVKGYWVHPDTVPGIAERNAPFRPPLDAGTAQAVHEHLEQMGVPGGYDGRWDRLFAELGVTVPERSVAEQTRVPEQNTDSPAARSVLDAVAKHRADQEKQRFEELIRNSWETDTVPETVPPILRLMRSVFDGRNAEHLPTKVILDDLPGTLNEHQLGRLMRACSVPGTEVVWDGKRKRGYSRDSIETAIKTSSWTQAAFGWEP